MRRVEGNISREKERRMRGKSPTILCYSTKFYKPHGYSAIRGGWVGESVSIYCGFLSNDKEFFENSVAFRHIPG